VYDRPLAAPEILELHERLADGQDKAIPPAAVGGPLATLTYEQIHTPGLLLDQVSGRRETYAVSRRMAADALWLGFGPGTFGWLYGLYRPSGTEPWAWYAHNDWLETLITFGRVGLALVILALITALTAGLFAGGLPLPGTFLGLVWVSLAGCLIHARYDFPFQVHSVTWLFLLLACLTFIGSPRPEPAIDH
jgi:O-antigen ligase